MELLYDKIKSTNMILFIVCILLFSTAAFAQSELVTQIEQVYNSIDTADYLEKIADSYMQSLKEEEKKYYRYEYYKKEIEDETQKKYDEFVHNIHKSTPYFVLNLNINNESIGIDSSCLKYNLFFYNKNNSLCFLVWTKNGAWLGHSENYLFFSSYFKVRKHRKEMIRVHKKILRKKPAYLLSIENRGNTVSYVIDDKIYVYSIEHRKEYELQEYIKLYFSSKSENL